MSWSTTRDIHLFARTAGAFLESRPVEHSILLTETAYLQAIDTATDDQIFGWSDQDGRVTGAFVQAPRHPPVVSPLTPEDLESLAAALPDVTAVGVPSADVVHAQEAWERLGTRLEPRSLIDVLRLDQLRLPPLPAGASRVATAADRDVLVAWFDRLMAGLRDDPTDRAYVVDDPLTYGGITLWEVEGRPVAMAGRSRLAAGMVRLSAIFAAEPGQGHDLAAFVSACEAASDLADHVLVFASADDPDASAEYAGLGFAPVSQRCLLVSVG